jgi:hypothetical protein
MGAKCGLIMGICVKWDWVIMGIGGMEWSFIDFYHAHQWAIESQFLYS